MSISIVATEKGPKALGPYSQAVKCGNLVFLSGCIPVNPATNETVTGSITEQTKQVFTNMKNIIEAAGSSMEKVVKVNVFLANMDDFAEMNTEYAKWFVEGKYPARSCVQVAKLPKNLGLEIECIASL